MQLKLGIKPLTAKNKPLTEILRPASIDQVVGQKHLTGERGKLRQMLKSQHISSIIFYGPPGSGKTTMARILCKSSKLYFEQISAIFSGVQNLKKIFSAATARKEETGNSTLLFVDEIHRFNKTQQDSFLPVIEDGTIVLIGATTENPSFELNNALLSRTSVLIFNNLDDSELNELITKAENIKQQKLPLSQEAKLSLVSLANGDGRKLLNLCDEIYNLNLRSKELDIDELAEYLQKQLPKYDKSSDYHYSIISALHKSIRGSDADASLYWFARMCNSGESRSYLARRLIRIAVEDIGMADPQALVQAIAAKDAFEYLGEPEGDLALAQIVVYLATAPKSNAVYKAFSAATKTAEISSVMPPKHLINGVTKLQRDQNCGSGYKYDHDEKHAFSGQNYFPESINKTDFYKPVRRGFEREIMKRLDFWNKIKENITKS